VAKLLPVTGTVWTQLTISALLAPETIEFGAGAAKVGQAPEQLKVSPFGPEVEPLRVNVVPALQSATPPAQPPLATEAPEVGL
jgi:hypothetical protein